MFVNATLTVRTKGETIDSATGYRTQGTQETVLKDHPCAFSQSYGSQRSVFVHGLREFTTPAPAAVVRNAASVLIKPGYQAEITCEGITGSYTVEDAVLSRGIAEAIWLVTFERIKT